MYGRSTYIYGGVGVGFVGVGFVGVGLLAGCVETLHI